MLNSTRLPPAAALAILFPLSLAGQTACTALAVPITLDGPRVGTTWSETGLRSASRLPGWICASGDSASDEAGLHPTPLTLRTSYRSAYPLDRNNGAVWDGKGATVSLGGGLRYLGPHVRVTLAPRIAFQENADFLTAPAA